MGDPNMLLYGQTNVPIEFSLTAARTYADPFNEVEVDVLFTGPDGQEWRVPAYWAGGGVFRVRFAAPEPGRYTYRSLCTRPDDAGLHGQTGDLEVAPYEGPHALYRHGRLRRMAGHPALQHADGTPFFWMGDTWWMGLAKRLDWPNGFRCLVADRVSKGFNLIQLVAGPFPDFDAETAIWDPQQANEGGWSWEPGWERINPRYYDLADLRIAYLVEAGLMPCIVSMWGYYLPFMGVERVKKHWRNLVARYGAYPVVWCLAGEVNLPTYSHLTDEARRAAESAMQEEAWTEVARYLRAVDPYHNVLTAHPWVPGSGRLMLRDDSLLDVDLLQTGHGGYSVLRPTVERVQQSVAKEPRMPVIDGEPAYEGIMGGSQQEVQRFLFWTCVTSGAAGHTYGAQGMWAMSSRYEPFRGTTMNWGDGYWQDVMHYPGSGQVALGRRLLERYPWWRYESRRLPEVERAGRIASFATGIPGTVWVFYYAATCMDGIFQGVQGTSIPIEEGASYRAFFFNPRTGAEVDLGPVQPGTNGAWPAPNKPSMEDWVLVLHTEDAAVTRP